MSKDNMPRAIREDMERLSDIAQSQVVDQMRFGTTVAGGLIAFLTGAFLSIVPFGSGMMVAWLAPTTANNLLIGLGVSGVALILTLAFVTLCTLPAAMSWMRMRANELEAAPERRQLAARVNLWHATGGNEWIRATMSLVHLLEEFGQGSVAQRAVEHLVALQRRSALLEEAAGLDEEADQARLVIDEQAAEVLDRLGNLALEAAKSDRLPLEELELAESDAKNRSRALAEVAIAASTKRRI